MAARKMPGMTARSLPPHLAALGPLLAAEAAAEAGPAGADPRDLEQAVWLRLLERDGPPLPPPARWLRDAVRAEVRGFRRRARREISYDEVSCDEVSYDEVSYDEISHHHRPGQVRVVVPAVAPSAERAALAAETRQMLQAAARRLPGRCPQVIFALLSRSDLTYHQISRELRISQGSLGPLRSRCIGCLRALLRREVELPQLRGTHG